MYTSFPIPQKDYYKVYVRSSTYNQSQYIVDCLNGVAMQKTDFPFIHHVVDDCSTDGEQEVIKSWIERECNLESAEFYDNDICTITLAKHKSNPNYTIAAYFLKRNMYGNPKKRELFKPWEEACPYIALCEGDDYWIDEYKLQKQYVFLEKNLDYGMVRTDSHRYIQLLDKMECSVFEKHILPNCKDTLEDYIINAHWLATCSWMVRQPIEEYVNLPNDCFKGDLALMLFIIQRHKVKYMQEPTVVYRVLENTTSHFDNIGKARVFFKSQVYTRCHYAKEMSIYNKIKFWIVVCRSGLHFFIINKKEKPMLIKDYLKFVYGVIGRIIK